MGVDLSRGILCYKHIRSHELSSDMGVDLNRGILGYKHIGSH